MGRENTQTWNKPSPSLSLRRVLLGLVGLLLIQAGAATADDNPVSEIGEGTRPAVASDVDGNAMVVYEDSDGDEQGIFARAFDSGGQPFGIEFQVNAQAASSQTRPDVIYLPTGDFVVVWEEDRGGASKVSASLLKQPFGIEFAQPFGIEFAQPFGIEFEIGSGAHPAIAADENGDFVVAWSAPDTDATGSASSQDHTHRIQARRFDASGQPTTVSVSVGAPSSVRSPDVAMRPDGESLVVWSDHEHQVRAQAFDATLSLLDKTYRINETGQGTLGSASATVALDESYVVSWEQDLEGERSVWVRRVNRYGQPISEAAMVSTLPSTEATSPAVAADSKGNIVVTWRCHNGGQDRVFARAVDLLGQPSGNSLQLSSPTVMATRPRIAPAGTGVDFLVVWEETGGAGTRSTPDVMGRFIAVPFTE